MVKDSLGLLAFILLTLICSPLVVLCGIFFFMAKYVIKSNKGVRYSFNLLYGIDQFANTCMAGHPEETISSRLGRTIKSGHKHWWVKFLRLTVDLLSRPLDGPNHCERAAINEGYKMDLSQEVWDWNKES